MKKLCCRLALGLSMIVPFCGTVFAQTADIHIKVTAPEPPKTPNGPDPCALYKGAKSSESIRLYYLRNASAIKSILADIVKGNDCIKDTVVQNSGDSAIVLYGTEKQRKEIQRAIAILDLPREGVNLEMWGILISSDNPEQLSEAMRRVNQEINRTQQLLQETYRRLEERARKITIAKDFKDLFEDKLGYQSALDNDRLSLSLVDILLRINAASDPIENYNTTAQKLCELFQEEQYQPYTAALKKRPFGNFARYGLHQERGASKNPPTSLNSNKNCQGDIKPKDEETERENLKRQRAVLDFALQYSQLAKEPDKFDPQSLQQSAENLNSLLNPLIGAINRDVEELFIEPTLAKIQRIVSEYDDVEYAEVGKTSVATLNGVRSIVSSTSVSAFNEAPPLRLNELITEAGQLNSSTTDLLPADAVNFGANAIPVSSVVSLIAALSKDRSVWRGLTSGISLDITPSVLRNSASAELDINFTIGPKEAGTQQEGVRPLSRISQNNVQTNVYVNTLDLFALSTFDSQTTVDGGRTYIPVIGTVWQGIFSGIPIFGDLFSWKNAPKNVQHQSIVLTNSFIIPTAMGIAPLFQQQGNIKPFYDRCSAVETYISERRNAINPPKSDTYVFGAEPSLDTKKRSICVKPEEVTPPKKAVENPKKKR